MERPDTSQTLEQFERDDWGEPTYDSYLVRTIHALRRKPIRDFTIEDLRITLGQKVGVEVLTPIALDSLERTPFAAGHFYPGDLLVSVMELPAEYWTGHTTEAAKMTAIAQRVLADLPRRRLTDDIKEHIRELIAQGAWRLQR